MPNRILQILCIFILLFGTNTMASFFTKKPNKEEFALMLQQRPVSGDFRIDNFSINGFEFPVNAIELIHFIRARWSEVDAKARTFSNIVFEDCSITDSNFSNIILKNVVFKNCSLHNVIFNYAKFDKLVFEHCKITSDDPNVEHSYTDMVGDSIHFLQSNVSNVSLFHGKSKIYIKNSKLNDLSGYGMKAGSLLSIENSDAFFINFMGSQFSALTVKNSRIRKSKVNDATIEKIVFENSDLEFPVANGNHGVITAINTKNVIIGGSTVKHVSISACGDSHDIEVGDLKFDTIKIDNCSPTDFIIFDSVGKSVSITNSTFYDADLRDMKIDSFKFENIRIKDKLNYKNAQVTNFEAKNITLDENVTVISEGANFNIKFSK